MTSVPPSGLALAEIARLVGGALEGPPEARVQRVAGLEEAGPDELTFLANLRYRSALATTRAGAVLVGPDVECPPRLARIRVADPYAALVKVLMQFDPGLPAIIGVHPTAVVASDAELGEGVGLGPHVVIGAGARLGARSRVGAGSVIGDRATLGEDCYLYPRVVVGRQCELGDRVIVHAGAVLGADGFGYALVDGTYRKVPQLGRVCVEDDVEIGANACIDRATFGATRIGRGTKIDNLVQVAHNVAIGEFCALAAQVGVAGSTRIGRGARLGGQAGLIGHLHIGDGASIGAQAGVIGDVADGETVTGYPARPHRDWLRAEAHLHRLPEILRRLREVERRTTGEPSSGENAS